MKEVTIIFFASWKFAATFPIAIYVMKMTVAETLIYTNIGGILGAFAFIYFSEFLIRMWNKYWPDRLKFHRKARKKFTRRNRNIIKIKTRYGLWGIVILSPVILSIPVGAFLMVKYYGLRQTNIVWLISGQIVWSLLFTMFYYQAGMLLL